MTNPEDYVFPKSQPQYGLEFGLTKFEFAVIHIAAAISANPQFGHELADKKIAEMAVSQARALFNELNK